MDFSNVKEWQIPEGKVASVSVGGVVIWQAKTQAEQLTAPTITLDGDTLTMIATDDRTEEFVIFVDGVEMATVEKELVLVSGTYVWKDKPNDDYNYDIYGEFVSNGQTFTRIHAEIDMVGSLSYYKSDGSSVRVYHVDSGWANIAYKTMVFTNNVSVEKHIFDMFMLDVMIVAGDTVQVSGTWYFNEVTKQLNGTIFQAVTFISNGMSFNDISISDDSTSGIPITYGDTLVYSYGGKEPEPIQGWQNEAYRTITFDGVQTVSKEFYDWLVANAVQTHKLLPIGTYIWNEDIYDNSYYYIDVEFVSNGETFAIVDSDMGDANSLLYIYGGSSYKTVYTSNGGWVNDAYRTMVFKTNAMIPIDEYDLFMSDVTYIKPSTEPV